MNWKNLEGLKNMNTGDKRVLNILLSSACFFLYIVGCFKVGGTGPSFLGFTFFWVIGTMFIQILIYVIIPTKRNKPKKNSKKKRATGEWGLRSDYEILNSELSDLTKDEFERLIFMYLTSNRYSVVQTTLTKSKGIDLVITDELGISIGVRVCHTIDTGDGSPISLEDIRSLEEVRNDTAGLDNVWCISSSGFSEQAKIEARSYIGMTLQSSSFLRDVLEWQDKVLYKLKEQKKNKKDS